MNGQVILLGFVLGGAALAAWLLVRFPGARPRRPATVVLAVLAVVLGLNAVSLLFAAVSALGSYGVALALLLVLLPALTLAFWISGAVLRTLAELPGVR